MLQTIKKIFSIEELKYKIVFTLLMLVVCRIGAYIPVPGINGDEVFQVFRQLTGGSQNLFQLVDIFSGGAFAQMTVIALGVMPYISASIIMQILVAVVPSLQREIRENGDAGKKKNGKGNSFNDDCLSSFSIRSFSKVCTQPEHVAPWNYRSSVANNSNPWFSVAFLLNCDGSDEYRDPLLNVDW